MTHITNFKTPKVSKAEGKRHMSKVARLPCCAVVYKVIEDGELTDFRCGITEVEVHHIRNHTGLGVRPSDMDTIPLCLNHHRGKEGIHTIGKDTWEFKFGLQTDLLYSTMLKIVRSEMKLDHVREALIKISGEE